jgi:hypothetical protein
MRTENIASIIARKESLKPVEENLQKLLHQAFSNAGSSGKKIKNFLNGRSGL